MRKYGPTVWDGVGSVTSRLRRGGLATSQHHVELVRERPLRHGFTEVEVGDHPLPVPRVAHRVEDRVLEEQRIAREVHLRHEARGERVSEQGEVDVGGAPGVGMVLPGVRARLDRDEAVAALVVGHAPPRTGEIRVERGRMAVHVVLVASRGVRLPDLDQSVAHGPPVSVEDAPVQDHPLPERLALVLPRQVVVDLADALVAVDRTRDLRQGVRERHERPPGRARPRGHVVRMQVGGIRALASIGDRSRRQLLTWLHLPPPPSRSQPPSSLPSTILSTSRRYSRWSFMARSARAASPFSIAVSRASCCSTIAEGRMAPWSVATSDGWSTSKTQPISASAIRLPAAAAIVLWTWPSAAASASRSSGVTAPVSSIIAIESLRLWLIPSAAVRATKIPPPGPLLARIRFPLASSLRASRSVGRLTPNSAARSSSRPRKSSGPSLSRWMWCWIRTATCSLAPRIGLAFMRCSTSPLARPRRGEPCPRGAAARRPPRAPRARGARAAGASAPGALAPRPRRAARPRASPRPSR